MLVVISVAQIPELPTDEGSAPSYHKKILETLIGVKLLTQYFMQKVDILVVT